MGAWTRDLISIKGQWKYLYRAVTRSGHTVDFLLYRQRERRAASRFFEAVEQWSQPEKIPSTRADPTARRSILTTASLTTSTNFGQVNPQQHC